MLTYDIIRTNYMLYEVSAQSSGKDETLIVIEVFDDDMDETIESSSSAIKENLIDESIAKAKNFFYNLFGFENEDITQYALDNEIVFKHSVLAKSYKKYFEQLRDLVNDDNYQEVYRLAMFTYDSYLSNYNYLDSLRDGIQLKLEGITYYGQGEDTSEEFDVFINCEFEKLKNLGKRYRK